VLPGRPLQEWGKFRWQDEALVVLWLHERTGNPKLLQLARLLHQQGYDWQKSFEHFDLTEKTGKHLLDTSAGDPRDKIRPRAAHGVNNAMGLKHSPVWCRLTGAGHDRRAFHEQLGNLDQYPDCRMGCSARMSPLPEETLPRELNCAGGRDDVFARASIRGVG